MKSRIIWLPIAVVLIVTAIGLALADAPRQEVVAGRYTTTALATPETQKCLECHGTVSYNLVAGWERGRHAENRVGCYECHQASATEPDAFEHHGTTVSTLVTPRDCGRCHQQQADEFLRSHHSRAGRILHSSDNYWGEVVEGYAASLNGCQSCHGSRVQLATDTRKPLHSSYPNSGIGRLNPDGSEGNCAACHQRHDFRMDAVRKAETCGRCHLGPDHPHLEIWHSSKHGQTFHESSSHLDLNARKLVLGRDPIKVPTCVTCHLGGTTAEGVPGTHDPGSRISWNLRHAVSNRMENWAEKRGQMQQVCRQCHATHWVEGHYQHLDRAVALYNHKFALPAQQLLQKLRAEGKLDPAPFNEKLEVSFWHLWHHEGRRARHAVAMMSADYTQWNGFYEVALNFYFEFIPEAERLLPGCTAEILARPEHSWFKLGVHTKADVEKAIAEGKAFWVERSPEAAK